MTTFLQHHPAVPLLVFVLIACLLWTEVRRVVAAIVLVTVIALLGSAVRTAIAAGTACPALPP